MATRLITLVCLVSLLLPAVSSAGDYYDEEIVKAVRQLGTTPIPLPGWAVSQETWDVLLLLARRPYEAVGLLIKELHPVTTTIHVVGYEQDKYPAEMHVVWCLRALRYLTDCQNFTGKTKHKFTGKTKREQEAEHEREWFLRGNSKTELPFFAVWISRDSVFFAPLDAQAEIIEKWKHWYATEGREFRYKECQNLDAWYFYLTRRAA
jgi:hypothetical protein